MLVKIKSNANAEMSAKAAKWFHGLSVNDQVLVETKGSEAARTSAHFFFYIVTLTGVRRAEDCESYLFRNAV